MTNYKVRPPTADEWTRRDIDELQRAAERSDVNALLTLGLLYQTGLHRSDGRPILRRSPRAARNCLERASAMGDPDAMCALADQLSEATTRAALSRASALYRRAFRRGNVVAAFNLAATFQNRGQYRDAVRWYRRAARAGLRSALLELARAELYGIGTRRDAQGALAKLRRLTSQRSSVSWPAGVGDDVGAMLLVADALRHGWLLPRDYAEALRWMERAAKRGSDVAKAVLEEMTANRYERVEVKGRGG